MTRAEALADALQPLPLLADETSKGQQPAIDMASWLDLAVVDLSPEEQQLVSLSIALKCVLHYYEFLYFSL